jgi:asparagine synthase (glutamine-hydrolysing)
MCGILGYLDKNFNSLESFKKMLDRLHHRGPNNTGIWKSDQSNLFLGHKRLSIQDLSKNGNQPMISQNKRFVIVFNGEIYNHFKLRQKLEISNILWKSSSDTETILESVSNIGVEKTIKSLVGMFAFAIYDQKLNKLYLCRDRFGEKPLYYGLKSNVLFFSSELNALNFSKFPRNINRKSLDLYLKYGYVPSPLSIFKDIKKVAPGEIITIDIDNLVITKKIYYNFALEINNIKIDHSITEDNIVDRFQNSFNDTIKSQTLSDIGYGVFLSSGIDSTLISALLSKDSQKKIDTFTIKIDDPEYDEYEKAKKISKALNTNFHYHEISSKNLIDKIDILPDVYDEPFSDSSQIPTLLLCEHASKIKNVFISGDGGDEILGGYNRHTQLTKFYKFNNVIKAILKYLLHFVNKYGFYQIYNNVSFFLPLSLRSSIPETHIKKILHILNANSLEEAYNKVISIWPEKYNADSISPWILNNNSLKDNEKFILNDTINYLPNDIFCKVDRASMYYSLETRAPYVDLNFVNFFYSIPNKIKSKYLSKKLSKKILEKHLPSELIYTPKKGFGIPLKKWLNGPLKDFLNDNLFNEINNLNEMFNYNVLSKKSIEHISSNEEAHKIWNILVFQLWQKKNL